MATLFTKIINEELPSFKVFEDDEVCAFLALDQIQKGHTLVVPKIEVDHWIDVPEPYFTKMHQIAKVLGAAILKATGAKKIGAAYLGFEVPHCHLHLVPISKESDMNIALAKRWPEEEMKRIQNNIKAAHSS